MLLDFLTPEGVKTWLGLVKSGDSPDEEIVSLEELEDSEEISTGSGVDGITESLGEDTGEVTIFGGGESIKDERGMYDKPRGSVLLIGETEGDWIFLRGTSSSSSNSLIELY